MKEDYSKSQRLGFSSRCSYYLPAVTHGPATWFLRASVCSPRIYNNVQCSFLIHHSKNWCFQVKETNRSDCSCSHGSVWTHFLWNTFLPLPQAQKWIFPFWAFFPRCLIGNTACYQTTFVCSSYYSLIGFWLKEWKPWKETGRPSIIPSFW